MREQVFSDGWINGVGMSAANEMIIRAFRRVWWRRHHSPALLRLQVDFDGVVITTPTPTHSPITALAAENKKHVFLEKPMALNLRECDEILNVISKNSVFLQLGFMRRFDPEFVAAAERIAAGEIGQPMMIKTNTHGPGLPPAWARDLRSSNGKLAEVNSHDWDTLRWFMGSNLQRVYAEVANFKGAANHVDTPNFYDNVSSKR